jgi:hypothetical protein
MNDDNEKSIIILIHVETTSIIPSLGFLFLFIYLFIIIIIKFMRY